MRLELQPDNSELSAISRLFSVSVVREIAQKGKSSLFVRLVRESNLLSITEKTEPIKNLFENAYSLLKKKYYRHEYVYKAAITKNILLGTHSLKTSSMLNEFRVEKCKADTVILNGTSTVYEIKSERDTLSRLEQQICAYRKVFACVNVIVGENHLQSALESTPNDVGVMLLTTKLNIRTIRNSIKSPERTIPEVIFDSVQLHEAKKILTLMNRNIPEAPNTQIHQELRKIFQKFTSKEDRVSTHQAMLDVLKETRSLLQLYDFIYTLPTSLQAAVFSSSLRKQDHVRLSNALDTPINHAITNWN